MLYRMWCLFLLCCVAGVWGQGVSERGLPPASPCPAVYGYGWEPAGGWHGLVTILPPGRFSEAQLVFRMTVPYYRPEAGVGRVEIKGGTAEVQAISRRAHRGERHQIQFMIIFPPFDEIPRVKEVIINGKTFCSDMRVYPETRSTIELKYVLRTGLSLPVANGNEFAIVNNNNNNNNRPSKPDLVTIAILVPLDEARPMVSNPQAPSQPIGSGLQPPRPIGSGSQSTHPEEFASSRPIGSGAQSPRPIGAGAESPSHPNTSSGTSTSVAKHPCKCNRTSSQSHSHNGVNENPDFPANEVPKHHVFHIFNVPNSSVQINNENIDDIFDIFTSTTPSVIRPGGSSEHDIKNSNTNGNKHHVTSNTPSVQRPVAPSGNGNHFNGNSFIPTTTNKPTLIKPSNHKEPVDDKIYFIMTDSDDVNSPRVEKLLEHLLVVAKKHYQVDLERLEIEKKRLALEKSPHFTLVL